MRDFRPTTFRLLALAAIATLSLTTSVASAQIVANGGFESGFSGWTVLNQLGSDGTFFIQSGTSSPVSGAVVPAPTGGIQAAMSDASGPGTHVLYQDFVVPMLPIAGGSLKFDVFIGNRATAFFKPATLDFSTPALNQQARVDILAVTADPFSVATADVLFNAFQTNPGDPLVSGYTTISADIGSLLVAHAGETLRLRFAEVDNVFGFQMGLDNVAVAVPEPSSVILCGIGCLLGWRRCRRRKNTLPTQG